MSYNKPRITISKNDKSCCDICGIQILKGESIFIIPKKYIAHSLCHRKKQLNVKAQ